MVRLFYWSFVTARGIHIAVRRRRYQTPATSLPSSIPTRSPGIRHAGDCRLRTFGEHEEFGYARHDGWHSSIRSCYWRDANSECRRVIIVIDNTTTGLLFTYLPDVIVGDQGSSATNGSLRYHGSNTHDGNIARREMFKTYTITGEIIAEPNIVIGHAATLSYWLQARMSDVVTLA